MATPGSQREGWAFTSPPSLAKKRFNGTVTDSPVFGIRIEGCRYTVRPSAYALLRDEDGRIAIVRAARGWFLPGGGIEADETADQAAQREAREECGLVIEPRRVVATATEIVHSPVGHAGVDKASVFIEAVVVGRTAPTEPDHELAWLQPADAIARLSHKSHRWALGIYNLQFTIYKASTT
jgi:8-oxo-dGTP diphosphatase